MTTPGMAAMLNPETSKRQASETVRQCNPTWANADGMEVAKCGSLDKIALPLSVWDPATTQELEPIPDSAEPEPRTCGTISLILAALSRTFLAWRSWSLLSPAARGRA